jgi:hypothetical protein
MKLTPKRRAGTVLALTLIATAGLGVASAQGAPTDHDVRESQFTSGLSDTRANGHYDFLKEGVRLYTDGNSDTGPRTDGGSGTWNTDKVAEYFPVGKPLAGVTDVDYDWYGTTPTPGQQYVMDFDNDGSVDGILVGEKVYGGQEVWLTNGSKDAYKGDGSPAVGGGYGTPNHGTLEQWSAKYPDAKIVYGGFSLGSGVAGDGVLRALTFGPDRYVFTDADVPVTPPTPETVDPAGTQSHDINGRSTVIRVKTAAVPADKKAGTLPKFDIYVNGSWKYGAIPAAGTTGTSSYDCAKGVQCVYKIYRNSTLISSYTIKK